MTLRDYDEATGDDPEPCSCGNIYRGLLRFCDACNETTCRECRDWHAGRECVDPLRVQDEMAEKRAELADKAEYLLTRFGIGWAIVVSVAHAIVAMAAVGVVVS